MSGPRSAEPGPDAAARRAPPPGVRLRPASATPPSVTRVGARARDRHGGRVRPGTCRHPAPARTGADRHGPGHRSFRPRVPGPSVLPGAGNRSGRTGRDRVCRNQPLDEHSMKSSASPVPGAARIPAGPAQECTEKKTRAVRPARPAGPIPGPTLASSAARPPYRPPTPRHIFSPPTRWGGRIPGRRSRITAGCPPPDVHRPPCRRQPRACGVQGRGLFRRARPDHRLCRRHMRYGQRE